MYWILSAVKVDFIYGQLIGLYYLLFYVSYFMRFTACYVYYKSHCITCEDFRGEHFQLFG